MIVDREIIGIKDGRAFLGSYVVTFDEYGVEIERTEPLWTVELNGPWHNQALLAGIEVREK